MAQTGFGLLEILALVAILLPLIPVFIIFSTKAYKQDTLALLMVLCLVSFIQNLILYIPGFVPLDILFIRGSFQLINYILLMMMMKLIVKGRLVREAMKILLVSFVSIVITIYCIKGTTTNLWNIEMIQALVLIVITLVALFQLIRSQDIFIFLSPLFWITAGTFFYYSMLLLTESIPDYKHVPVDTPFQQKKALLMVMILIQFIFYSIAAAVAGDKNKEQRITQD